jgi:hypothetical protein
MQLSHCTLKSDVRQSTYRAPLGKKRIQSTGGVRPMHWPRTGVFTALEALKNLQPIPWKTPISARCGETDRVF